MRCASPPCLAAEFASGWTDSPAQGLGQLPDVAAWRNSERRRLITARQALDSGTRCRTATALAGHLIDLLGARFGGGQGRVLSGYWPIRGEPDLRPLMSALHAAGMTVVLPVVETQAAPLVFRLWTPATRLVRGVWGIPVPPMAAPAMKPDIVLAPLVGWDCAGFRLGHGGGYFDRTLAAAAPSPVAIGVGFEAARLATIHPQPHDIPLEFIVTEAGLRAERTAR